MNKEQVTSRSLMDDAAAYYVNLKNTGSWKTEMSRNSQLIALTTQLTELKTEMGKLSSNKAAPKVDESKPAGGKIPSYVFVLRKLITKSNTTWSNAMERPVIGAISTSITTKASSQLECTSLTNQTATTLGLNDARNQSLEPQLLLRLQLQPNLLHLLQFLMIRLLRSFLFQNLFRLHWSRLLASLRINSRKFGKMHAMPRETRWPRM